MNVLLAGHEPVGRVTLLLKLTSIKSEAKQAALYDHLSHGMRRSVAAALNGVDTKNFQKCLATLNEAAAIVEQIKEYDGVTKLTITRGQTDDERNNVREL